MILRHVLILALGASLVGCGEGSTEPRPTPPTGPTLTATVSASPSSGFAPLSTSVTVSSRGTATGPANYHVDFGDGASLDTTASQNSYVAAHVYQSGTYTVSVRVDRQGLIATTSTTVTVNPPPTLTATVSASPSSGFAPLSVQFTIARTGTASGPTRYRVDYTSDGAFDADTISDQATYVASNSYANLGIYTARACVTQQGIEACTTATVTVESVPPVGSRVTRDRPDEVSELQIKIVYFTSADGPDRGLDTTGVLANSVASFQNWFAGATAKIQRQDTYQGRLDIAYFRSAKTDAQIAARGAAVIRELYDQLVEASINDPNKKYLIYYDGSSTFACGGALLGGKAAAMYLRAILTSGINCGALQFVTSPTAPPRYWEFAMLHDSFHLTGIVDRNAPDHYDPNPYHVNNPADVMHGGVGGWNPSTVDTTGRNYYGDSVPEGVKNLKYDSILIPAPASVMVQANFQMNDLRASPQAIIPHHVHELVQLP